MPCMSLLLAKSGRIPPSIVQSCRRTAPASLRHSSFLDFSDSRRNIMTGSSASGVNRVADIPTLAQLHADGELPEPEDKPQFGPDEALNKRVSIWRGEWESSPPAGRSWAHEVSQAAGDTGLTTRGHHHDRCECFSRRSCTTLLTTGGHDRQRCQ